MLTAVDSPCKSRKALLFLAIEESLQQELTVSKAREMSKADSRAKIVKGLFEGEDVKFYLSLL